MAPLKITWINPDRIVVAGNFPTAQRIDVRLRSVLPGALLASRGHQVAAVAMPDMAEWGSDANVYRADVYIIGKTLWDVSPVVHRIRQTRAKIILDLCDNVFEPPEDGPRPHTQAILPLVHGIVTSTDMLRDAVVPHLPEEMPMTTIPDFVEGSRRPPRFSPSPEKLKLLWFGYWNNLPHVHRLLPLLAKLTVPVELTMVTGWDPRVRMGLEGTPHGIRTRLVEWSIENLAAELARTDMVVVPSSQELAFRTRSPNRLITALWAGRYVVAYPLPSYRPFALFAGIGEDLPAQVLAALRDPTGTKARIAAGQAYIATEFSNDTLAERWESFARRI